MGSRAHLFIAICLLQVFAEKMGLETGWNCHISLTPNGDMPGSEIPPSSPSHAGSLHDDLNQGKGTQVCGGDEAGVGSSPSLELQLERASTDPSQEVHSLGKWLSSPYGNNS